MRIHKDHARPPWLLLTFTLPALRASRRVEVWRKIQRLGAIPLGNSGYLLPNDSANRERFEWLASSVRTYQGEASVLQVQSVDNLSPKQIALRFQEARAGDYRALLHDLQKFSSLDHRERSSARLGRLRHRLQEIAAIDYFRNPLRRRVERLLDTASKSSLLPVSTATTPVVSRRNFLRRLWVTRPRPGVDRVASAWLIRRFIDSKARFGFAAEDEVSFDAVRFDMFQGGFGHRGDDCTIETLRKQFRIRDRRVQILSEIIHDADLGDDKFGRAEGFGLDEILKGWARLNRPDREILERGIEMVEGLYRSLS
jgi:hypothetical protein